METTDQKLEILKSLYQMSSTLVKGIQMAQEELDEDLSLFNF